MTIAQLLADLADAGVILSRSDDQLHVQGPSGVISPDLLQRVRNAKQALLEILEDQESQRVMLPPPSAGESGDVSELSRGQQRLVLATRLGEPAMYNEQAAIRFAGSVDVEIVKRAFDALARKHDILRTIIVEGEPLLQTVLPDAVVRLEAITVQTEDELRARAAAIAKISFDLKSPLWRVDLFLMPDGTVVLVLTIHHAIFDRWTMALLIRDFSYFLTSRTGGDQKSSAPRFTYRDFAAWQHRWLQTADYHKQLDWWEATLGDLADIPLIRGDRPRAAVPTFRAGTLRIEIPVECVDAASAFSRKHNTTLFTTLLSIFQMLRQRYTGEGQSVTLTPVASRQFQEAENVAGYFVNLIMLAGAVHDEDSFRSLVERNRSLTAEAFAHQFVPFDAVVERLVSRGHGNHVQFSHAVFALQNVDLPVIRTEEGEATPFDLDNPFARFDLYLSIEGDARGMFAVWQYSADLFDAESIQRMGRHFIALLRAALASPETPLRSLPMLSEAEERQVIFDWNNTPPVGKGFRLHELIGHHASSTPLASAIVGQSDVLTYGELQARQRRIATAVLAAGAAREPVAVFLPRSVDAVAAYAGVMLAGCAYVPADPAMPPRRLQDLLHSIDFVLTTKSLASLLEGVAVRIILIDEIGDSADGDIAALPTVASDDLAYVMFTSGSTGKPKGVMIEHGSASLTIEAILRRYDINASDRLICVSSAGFDLSVFDFFGAFAVGAAVILAPESLDVEPGIWLDLMEREQVTVWESVPAVMELLLAECRQSGRSLPSSLRLVMLSGDRVPVRLPGMIRAASASDLQVISLGGATEAAIWSCSFDTNELSQDAVTVPYGRALPGQRFYVLSEELRPVPIGVPGDLWIAGGGVARGYLGEPELTDARFVSDPYFPGERMYKTGDRACVLADGNHEFLGRVDDQVKIAGFRIEIGEIDAALSDVPGVERGVAAIIQRDERRVIVAYVVLQGGVSFGPSAIREALQTRLPTYMMPTSITPIDALPLTANGKVDRSRLPEPPVSHAENALDGALTPNENVLLAVLREVLGVDDVHPDSNYFALGGDSIRSLRIASRTRELGFKLRPRTLIEQNSVSAIAATMTRLESEELSVAADVRLIEGVDALIASLSDIEDIYGLTPMQEGMLYHSLEDSGMYVEQLSCGLSGEIDVGALQGAWADLVGAHPVLRTSFHWERVARPVQVVHGHVDIAWRIEALPDDLDLDGWLRADRALGLDLRSAPCLRCALLATDPDRHELVVTYSHLLLDGWSLSLLIGQLAQFYKARLSGLSGQSVVSTPFSRYVAWSQSAFERGAGEAFWRGELADFDGARDLALPMPEMAAPDDRPFAFEMDKGGIEVVEKRERVTFASVVAGCWAVLLSRYGGSDDVLFGMTSSGRRAEIDGSDTMVGVLIETRPARVKVDEQAALGSWLRSLMQDEARREEVGAVSLAQIETWSGMERGARLFETLLVVENYPQAPLAELLGEGITVENVHTVERTNWPLTVVVVPEGDRLRLTLLYDPARYERLWIEQVGRHFVRLLNSAARAQHVGDLEMLEDDERARLVGLWSGAEKVLASPRVTLVERIEEQVSQRPEATALRLGERRISYGELSMLGRRAASRLQREGACVGTRVAIVGDRTMDTIVAMYGILLSGAAYVPLDPGWPEERKRMVIEDALPLLVVGEAGAWCETVPQLSLEAVLAWQDETLTGTLPTAEDLAYVIFTSGSTGRPKGVMVRHGDVMHLDGLREQMGLNASDVWTAFHSYAFDYSILEIWYALMLGATVVPVPYWVSRSPEAFKDLIHAEGATIICQTPAAFQQLCTLPRREGVTSPVRWVVLSGDMCLASSFAGADPADYPNIANAYGITETTVVTTFERLEQGQPVTIGQPFAGQRVYLLDRFGRLVPPGAVGEIHIAGEGIAAGYLGAQELTAQRFTSDPYYPDAKMYRSGDLARFLPDGRLEVLGRADRQVKVRGHRIELGEVESALSSLPSVREAVAAVRERNASNQLIAWYVAAEDTDAQEIREGLKSLLPNSAIPSILIRVDAMPLTANGKIDRKALPQEDGTVTPLLGPRNQTEQALAEIWCQVLARETIGVNQNFFDAGGDSIAIVRAHSEIIRLPGAEGLRIVDLFQRPTIAAIAAQISSGEHHAEMPEADNRSMARQPRAVRRRSMPSEIEE
ncbi:non-ribosomal peptide synthetase [Rhizobium skierniewicense]|uniref:non-ribosomal peptide synthetase n=1 Tax=Rhizobium skierniewicense TaxID=984260 RepID=UPI0015722BD4|nr:non-ribosomal peptide synthetase [Rhizobium skierniewicense]NTF35013.1 amino acid adenylation domain-containing protein [Rhizobium skierniewicense]